MNRETVAGILDQIGTLLELRGENAFKVKAYHLAARTVLSCSDDLERLVFEDRLEELQGIGEALSEKIREIVTTGSLRYHSELLASTPPGLIEMLRVPSLGPRKVCQIHEQLNVDSLAALEGACLDGRVAALPGFGIRSQEKVLGGLRHLMRYAGHHLHAHALEVAKRLEMILTRHPDVIRVAIAGSVRRAREIVSDIDLVCSTCSPGRVADGFLESLNLSEILARGPTKTSVRLKSGLTVDLCAVRDVEFAPALMYFTGSKEHNTRMRGRARQLGLELDEHGLYHGDDPIPCGTEQSVFESLGLAYVVPELREDQGEIEAALERRLPALVEPSDLQGVLHCHTRYSDGDSSIREMALAARGLGFGYIGITDHSRSASYAGGLQPDRVRQQWDEIDSLNRTLKGIEILKGIEADILPDGSLDYPDEILAGFDFVIGSVHSSFGLDREAQTRRIVRAIRSPFLSIVGHPTGRLLLDRSGYEVDLDRVMAEAANRTVALEFNANPQRLDLDWRYIKRFVALGGVLSVNPDAHSVEGLSDLPAGLLIARKGWLTSGSVLNAMGLDGLREWFAARRGGP